MNSPDGARRVLTRITDTVAELQISTPCTSQIAALESAPRKSKHTTVGPALS